MWVENMFARKLILLFSGRHVDVIACDTTTIRLVSSGAFENSVTVYLRQISDEDIDGHMNVVCLPEDMLEK
ncbi:hypothetical protein JTB14_011898 [Gonioctena quinquepunctata]|nr:hypothetical protein JTB14_011898 [Gonioctena quinquepunctata]